MICVSDRRIDCWGGWIWPSVLILPFFPKDPCFLDSAEVCSVAVPVTVCSVLVGEVVHLKWAGNGNKSWHRAADFCSAVLHTHLSFFPLLSENLWFHVLK